MALAAAVGSVMITLVGLPLAGIEPLTFQSDRNELIDPELDWNRRYVTWLSEIHGAHGLYVVIDPGPTDAPEFEANRAQARTFADDLAARLLSDGHVETVVWRFRRDEFSPRALRLLPEPQFSEALAEIRRARPMLEAASPNDLMLVALREMGGQDQERLLNDPTTPQSIADLARVVRSCTQALTDDSMTAEQFAWSMPGDARHEWTYLETGRLLVMRVSPQRDEGSLSAVKASIASVRRAISEGLPACPGVEAGLTGIEVVEADETTAATRDSAVASIFAVALITVLIITAFAGWRIPLMAILSLLVAVAWSFGYLTIAIGHLQVISVVFTVILLGLGVAYGVHVASRFELIRHDYADGFGGLRSALRESLESMGPGVITGAVTTAAAFCTTMLTRFVGVAEMGHIAAAGIILCLVSMLTVFPALLRAWTPRHHHHVPMLDRTLHLFEDKWVMPFVRRPWVTLSIGALVTVASLVAASRMQFDYDLMKLQPAGIDSIEWQQRISAYGGRSIWTGISIVENLDAARQRIERFAAQPTIRPEFGGVGMLFPPDEALRMTRIGGLRDELAPWLEKPPVAAGANDAGVLIAGLTAVRLGVSAQLTGAIPDAIRGELQALVTEIDELQKAWLGMDAAGRAAGSRRLAGHYARWRQTQAQAIASALDPAPIGLDDVPPALIESYVSQDGRLAIEVQPRLDDAQAQRDGPLHPLFLGRFHHQMTQVDPEITGTAVQIYRSGQLIWWSYRQAALWALIVVFVLVVIDFQNFHDALLSVLPVAVGFATTFGVMWLAGMTINPANIIVLPLMFGIGVDSGVHMLHRWRQDPVGRPLGLTGGTGKGITLTSLTAMIGFGSLMIAKHRGIASLGFVLTLGIAMTMLACWTMLPAYLELRSRGDAGKQDAASVEEPLDEAPDAAPARVAG